MKKKIFLLGLSINLFLMANPRDYLCSAIAVASDAAAAGICASTAASTYGISPLKAGTAGAILFATLSTGYRFLNNNLPTRNPSEQIRRVLVKCATAGGVSTLYSTISNTPIDMRLAAATWVASSLSDPIFTKLVLKPFYTSKPT